MEKVVSKLSVRKKTFRKVGIVEGIKLTWLRGLKGDLTLEEIAVGGRSFELDFAC